MIKQVARLKTGVTVHNLSCVEFRLSYVMHKFYQEHVKNKTNLPGHISGFQFRVFVIEVVANRTLYTGQISVSPKRIYSGMEWQAQGRTQT